MNLNHFESSEAVLEYATATVIWDLREDLSRMTGSEADKYTDGDCAALEDKIADLEVVSNRTGSGIS
ncbi:hypothetical protein HGG71_02825 [Rhodobacteraceae bacterium R_SAG2]|nr:hypothetical protein [Rhodobacteraceae bacterium R_SAG2]